MQWTTEPAAVFHGTAASIYLIIYFHAVRRTLIEIRSHGIATFSGPIDQSHKNELNWSV